LVVELKVLINFIGIREANSDPIYQDYYKSLINCPPVVTLLLFN